MRCDECKWGVYHPAKTIEHPETKGTNVVRSRWPFSDRVEVYTKPAWTEKVHEFIDCHRFWPEYGWHGLDVSPDWFCSYWESK